VSGDLINDRIRWIAEALHDRVLFRERARMVACEFGAGSAEAMAGYFHDEHSPPVGVRNDACIALKGIGPAAKDALPALRRILSDPSPDVRNFAAVAIASIERLLKPPTRD
jgi:hypothetical protein